MGGNLIKHYGFEAKRLPRREYFEIVSKVETRLASNGLFGIDIPTFRNKMDFGDLDFLCLNTHNNNLKEMIKQEFSPSFIHSNGNIYSFEIDGFQIDLITVSAEEFHFAKTYFCYSDTIGNLFGRFAHKMGLKLGWEGLKYVIREEHLGSDKENSHVVSEFTLTLNPKDAWEFLGADFYQIQEGFEYIDDAFYFVLKNKYFNPDIFSFENLNHINRVRNRKRENYQKFVEYVERNKCLAGNFQYQEKSSYLPMIMATFPSLKREFEIQKYQYDRRENIKKKFNGEIVFILTGRTGKDLGCIMSHMRKSGVEEIVCDSNANQVKDLVMYYDDKLKKLGM